MSWLRRKKQEDCGHATSSREAAERSLDEARLQSEQVDSAVRSAKNTVRQIDEFAEQVNKAFGLRRRAM